MTLAPLLSADWPIPLHAFAAFAALAVGVVQLLAPKGTTSHRALGYVWVALMAAVAGSSFSIHVIKQWRGFSLIHLLSIITAVSLPLGVVAARRGAINLHRRTMLGLFVGGLVVAGLFTLLPGRIMHDVVLSSSH